MLHGVDISNHQPDWLPADNDAFCFIKSTEGRTYTSEAAPQQATAARAGGMQVGWYHFLWPGNAVEQARYFVQQTDLQPGEMIACDWETTTGGHPSVDDAAQWIAEVKRLKPGHRVGLYCNASDWLNTSVKAGDYLWIAHYTTAAEPGISSTWSFWQYSDKPIDQDYGHFDSLDSLKAWANGTRYSIKYQSLYVELGSERYITPIDKQIVIACATASGWGTVRLSQGGLSISVAKSAMTHAGLGAGDVAIDGRPKDAVWALAAHLIRSGVVAFPRGYGGDSWADQRHIHWVSVESAAHAHKQAQDQIKEYLAGGDGLVGDKPYNGPDVPLGSWDLSPYNPKNIKADTGRYIVDTAVLIGRDVDFNKVRTRMRGYEIQAAKQIYRWGRWNVVTATPTYYAAEYLENCMIRKLA